VAREFEGRVAVVTGASSGIGLRTAERLVEDGALVALFARSEKRLQEIAQRAPDRMLAVAGDVADPRAIDGLFSMVESRFGDCDLLVNNAGTVHPKLLVETTLDEWNRVISVNLTGVFLASKRALLKMLSNRRGTIVNVSSISGVVGSEKFPGMVSYCASKAAVIGLTEALAAEVVEYGVRVNSVSPGSVDTAMLRRAAPAAAADMTPDQVAETILFLASDRSSPINGQNLHVYGP
jgi:NAD(P)-dependent dehydrogenase (short-subunit alcohol dehydrogenase family)